jgi:hypothetical protein
MIRGLLRFVGFWLFAAALVAAVLDGVRSIAASGLVFSPVAETWEWVAPDSLAALRSSIADGLGQPWLWDLVNTWVLGAPTALALGVLGLLLIAAGAKRRRDVFIREFAV